MDCIGLTGGVATGKSTVAGLLAGHGAAVVDADAIAREVVTAGSPALAAIVDRFGPAVLTAAGSLDRRLLAGIVFADADRRRELERITHPRIEALIGERVATARASGVPLVVVDVPLLFETGVGSRPGGVALDGVMVVLAPSAVQLARLMARDHLGEADAAARIAAQLPLEERRRRATWLIDNGTTLERTRDQVERWWEGVVAGRRAPAGG